LRGIARPSKRLRERHRIDIPVAASHSGLLVNFCFQTNSPSIVRHERGRSKSRGQNCQ
jgi:hypothetical protein